MMHEEKEFSDLDDDYHGHSHNHSKGHDHSHGHDHDHGSCNHESHRVSQSEWNNLFNEDQSDEHDHNHDHESGAEMNFDDLVNVVQFGSKAHLIHLIQSSRDLLFKEDSKGNSILHWAAKRGEVEIIQALVDLGAQLDTAGSKDPHMLPIHWAAADGRIDALEYFISKGQDINRQDANGSTPAIIATQYGQVNTLIYLYKHGAELTLPDNSGDHVLHWAAYKGNEEILQVMLYLYPRELYTADRFGQTAFHLGALRGYANIVEILLRKYHADHSLRDKSGKTPLELSMEKRHYHIEWIIKKLTYKSTLEFYKKVFTEDRKFLLAAMFGSNDYERCVWQWRITFLSNFYATYCLLQFTFDVKMNDLYNLHILNVIFVILWWILFLGCLWKEPGFIVGNLYSTESGKGGATSSSSSRNGSKSQKFEISGGDIEEGKELLLPREESALYEKGLNIIGRVESSSYVPVLCHSCHVERPLRSKHDRFIDKCVYKFDHFCPFVYNAVGRDNYRFFMGLLLWHPIAYLGFVIENIYYYYRADSISYLYYVFFLYSMGMCLMVMCLAAYHIKLVRMNLTTNEDSNKRKYEYLNDEISQVFHNPFDMNKTFWQNVMEVLMPNQKVYYTRIEAIRGEIQENQAQF